MVDKEKQQLVEAAALLKENCKKYDLNCDGCVFNDNGCALYGDPGPNTWKIPTLPRWSDADKAYAAAIKQFGVYAVRRHRGCIRYLIDMGFAKRDDNRVDGALADLKEDEEIAIDDIINEEV